MKPLAIGIAGAGLLGRLLAWRLSALGHRVSVFDPAPGPQPRFRGELPEGSQLQAAGFTAAGMLSPLAELDNAEPAVAALGWRSLALWRDIVAALPDRPYMAERGSLLLAHRPDLGAARRVLDRLAHATQSASWIGSRPAGEKVQPLTPAQLREIEPAVQGPAHAWLLPGEGQIDTVATLMALHAASPAVQWHWGRAVRELRDDGSLQFDDGQLAAFDWVIDVRGTGAAPHWPVRGVRGELVWLRAPGHGLQRPVRLLHPRHRVYLVPRPGDLVLVGASEVESEDRSPVSLRSAVELMAAAHSVVPALAEARILRLDVNLRPALPDNAPRSEWRGRCLRINGLFRHGWLLAPALVDDALRGSGLCTAGLSGPVPFPAREAVSA